MKYLRQFAIILLISLAGELLSYLLPLPIPASIYGILLLFALLCIGLIHVESVKEVSAFLIQIMPVMFIPAGVGLMESFGLLMPSLFAYVFIMAISTFAVMIAAGHAAQAVIRRSAKEEKQHE